MTLGLLKACSKGLVLKDMFIQYSVGERITYDGTGRTQDEKKRNARSFSPPFDTRKDAGPL